MIGKIPTTVITGFLGAGKTTLIRHVIDNAEGRRIALIINEFGDLGVDGGILSDCGQTGCQKGDIVELSNGCICCTVADDFLPAMKGLIERDIPPEHIIIETSGLALPQPLVQAFNWPEIRNQVSVDGVVALVDGPAYAMGQFAHDTEAVNRQRAADDALDHETPLHEIFEDQLTAADMVIVTKADLLKDMVVRIQAELEAKTRAGTRILTASMGRVDPKVLLGMGLASELAIESRPAGHHHASHDHSDDDAHHDHDHDAFESFIVTHGEISDPESYAEKLSAAAARHKILRIKGFGAVAEKPMRLVFQGVGPRMERYFDRPFSDNEPRKTRLVVIGLSGLDKDAISADITP